MSVNVNTNGIHELIFSLKGETTVALTSPGITTLTNDPPVVGTFYLNSGAVANPAAWALAPRASDVISQLKVYAVTADPTVALDFDIKQNGTSILSTPVNLLGGATGLHNYTSNLANTPLSIAQDDFFTLVITSGSALWTGIVQLE